MADTNVQTSQQTSDDQQPSDVVSKFFNKTAGARYSHISMLPNRSNLENDKTTYDKAAYEKTPNLRGDDTDYTDFAGENGLNVLQAMAD